MSPAVETNVRLSVPALIALPIVKSPVVAVRLIVCVDPAAVVRLVIAVVFSALASTSVMLPSAPVPPVDSA